MTSWQKGQVQIGHFDHLEGDVVILSYFIQEKRLWLSKPSK